MSGWFGGFAQPSDYPNGEMPNFNMDTFLVSCIFVIPYVAFLILLPGARRKRIVTVIVFTIMTFVGAALAAALYMPGWSGGSARIVSQYRSHVNERIQSQIGVHMGLTTLNLTLKYEELLYTEDPSGSIDMSKVFYNEKYSISGVTSMKESLHAAYDQGLPYPMLSVLEYFSLNADAFDWGKHYRVAGHYAHAAIWFGIAVWGLAVVLLLLVPHHVGQAMLTTGISSLISVLLYLICSPCELQIAFVGPNGVRVNLEMSFRWAFYLTFAAGIVSVAFGLCLIILQHYRVYTLSTFLDAYLDENVGPKRRYRIQPIEAPIEDLVAMANSLEIMKRCRHSPCNSVDSNKELGASSGFQSRSSYARSIRSQDSIETVHDEQELERRPSNLTISDTTTARIRSRNSDHEGEIILHVERL